MHGLVPAANGTHLVIQAADLRRRCGVSSEAGCSAELQRFLEIKIGYPNSWMRTGGTPILGNLQIGGFWQKGAQNP
jgi:hypothetical protein